jgi:tRNA pseudouridine38-40 synthase
VRVWDPSLVTADHEGSGAAGAAPEASGDEHEPTARLRLDLAYDGTDFSGWARQPGLRTVQGELESALATVLRLPGPVRVTCAGRTDAGVHARGQVAHADVPEAALEAAHGPERLVRRLSGVLPPDVRVRAVRRAPEGFDARWSARSRTYAYRVSDAPGGTDPLLRRFALHHTRRGGGELDLEAMNAAAQALLGEHDFAAFCRARPGASSVRTLLELEWSREAATGLAAMWVTADAFCHSMVRSVVGALLPVGDGRRPAAWPGSILDGRRRDPDADVAPAVGLTLERITYVDDDDLAAQAQLARRVRGPVAG